MASKKKESEGIALLSMYGDEDDDMEDLDNDGEQEPEQQQQELESSENMLQIDVGSEAAHMEEDYLETSVNYTNDGNRSVDSADDVSPPPPQPPPPVSADNSTALMGSPRAIQQVQLPDSPPTPPLPLQLIASETSRKGTLTIVDYGHDEVALSPEPEEGEIMAMGGVIFGADLQTVNGTPPGTVLGLTPNTQATPSRSSEMLDLAQSDGADFKANELESAEQEETVKITGEEQKSTDPLDILFPAPPVGKCSDEVQEKIIKFISLKKKTGRSYNSEVRNRKEYRNPDFLLHAVTYQDIDQIGSCFSKDVFDPHGYDKSDYYDEIEADMKRELERKEQEKKKNQKVDFISTGTQAATIPTPKITPVLAIPTVTSGLPSVSAAEAVARDGRPSKKSKWDKVDVDRSHLPMSGQESLSSVGAHAALLSAANAGTGYTAFAQQRRREAEERRSSDRKSDRRS